MRLQDQRTIEVLEAQMPEISKDRKDKSHACQTYRAPEVFLIGKATHLMAASAHGEYRDDDGWWMHRQ